ncbi:hypothetical protein GOHSU_14_00070 [Gordonia hirsuta DSM 44140 = NBRC 16056]|uniref:DUF4229 domain-containing protein n=1 Tax=Gordonia hirsuta DSM 44140 = NBRC 16056 TaxID=1121927 RepID=L7L6R4_9ACTN|nr:DUF4229 domain-containing protein [Gordonia hirsuta]GAC56840.1 hypothetical protein GOHSU_14_00070 [Gordonia hirsuta DSM 44140 = NBRC 16056]
MTDDLGGSAEKKATAASLTGWVALYTLVRMGLVVVVAALIMGIGYLFGVTVPLLAAALFGVVIALPIGMFLFKSVRLKVNEQISLLDADRAARREDLHARLRGDQE